ncbi:hypothetical protein [Pseudomonas sp.]|uniref:hypothetical protein n=1 Tax=Pseudomonas sp. TaxID=306 RepID=UPI0028A6DF81|nr:hypothetical protein [Pseudomonas sp.]
MAIPLAVWGSLWQKNGFAETVLLLELQDYSLADRKQPFLVAIFCLEHTTSGRVQPDDGVIQAQA